LGWPAVTRIWVLPWQPVFNLYGSYYFVGWQMVDGTSNSGERSWFRPNGQPTRAKIASIGDGKQHGQTNENDE
jgi:hypothetical protein